MTNCTSSSLEFPACRKRRVAADFSGGDITSNGGVLLLRQADRLSGLTASVARRLIDARQRGKVEHRFVAMLRQRVFGLALGYEDVNDHAALRHDLALQTAAERDCALAIPSTLSRFENAAGRDWAWNIHEVLVEDFIASHSEAPEELILDFDATDDAVHGRQVGRFFHGYYDHYCFLPLYVFCGERLLVSYLRPSKIDGAKHAWAILALLVKRLRQAWPGVRIVLRGDSGFCRHKMLSWCERQGVGYIVGLAKNARLNDLAAPWMETAAQGFAGTGFKQRLFGEFAYAAGTWNAERRVIARIEHGPKGANPRYIVTNLEGDAQDLYADIPHMPSKFVEFVPLSHRQGNCIPYAAIRWHDFGNRPALGRPLGHFSRHPDTPLLSLSPRRRFPRPTPERVFVADHQSSSGFSGTGPSAPTPQPIGT